ncbi:MAG: VOC family protein [Burkholderiaceae bacterium]|nr:VOC family protein [Burkholderiaceae bacterium]
MNSELDHLVVVAQTLEQGAAWCQATLGVAPGPGGRHALMGTHNRLLRIDGPGFAQAYLEIIAIDPEAPPPSRARWFGLDDAALQQRLREQGPQLHHAVLRSTNVDMLRWGLITLGCQPGPLIAAARDTPAGRLAWQILVRDDGAIDLDGHLPTLIQWQGRHPTEAMPASGVVLRSATLGGVPARLHPLLRLRAGNARLAEAGPAVQVELDTPRGRVALSSPA